MVKSVTIPGKCYAISDGDRQEDPILNVNFIRLYHVIVDEYGIDH